MLYRDLQTFDINSNMGLLGSLDDHVSVKTLIQFNKRNSFSFNLKIKVYFNCEVKFNIY